MKIRLYHSALHMRKPWNWFRFRSLFAKMLLPNSNVNQLHSPISFFSGTSARYGDSASSDRSGWSNLSWGGGNIMAVWPDLFLNISRTRSVNWSQRITKNCFEQIMAAVAKLQADNQRFSSFSAPLVEMSLRYFGTVPKQRSKTAREKAEAAEARQSS